MRYCKDAYKLLKIKTICGQKCPLYGECPRLLMEDVSDKIVEESMKKLIGIIMESKNEKNIS